MITNKILHILPGYHYLYEPDYSGVSGSHLSSHIPPRINSSLAEWTGVEGADKLRNKRRNKELITLRAGRQAGGHGGVCPQSSPNILVTSPNILSCHTFYEATSRIC